MASPRLPTNWKRRLLWFDLARLAVPRSQAPMIQITDPPGMRRQNRNAHSDRGRRFRRPGSGRPEVYPVAMYGNFPLSALPRRRYKVTCPLFLTASSRSVHWRHDNCCRRPRALSNPGDSHLEGRLILGSELFDVLLQVQGCPSTVFAPKPFRARTAQVPMETRHDQGIPERRGPLYVPRSSGQVDQRRL